MLTRRAGGLLLGVGLLSLGALSGCETEKPEDHPAYRKAVAVEERVVKVENQAEALVSMNQDLDQLKTQVRVQNGQLEELAHAQAAETKARQTVGADAEARLKALEDRLKALESKAPEAPAAAETPAKAEALSDKDAYQRAVNWVKQKDYTQCSTAFESFLNAYPNSALIDNALYWSGACDYSDNRLGESIATLTKLLKDHPDSRKIPDALLVMARAEVDLKRPKVAKDLLKRLIHDYPDSPVVAEAKSRLKTLDSVH